LRKHHADTHLKASFWWQTVKISLRYA
jgi:hypothetical protein